MANDNNSRRKEYETYFQEILKEVEKEFEKSDNYSKKIDAELARFADSMPSKGTQYYLIEHIKNAISLQMQRQSLIKDKFSIKKAILDYAMKSTDDENAGKTLFDELAKIVNIDKQKLADLGKKIEETKIQDNLDEKIDELLSKSEEEEE
jgi:hypothetical protein